MSDSESLTAYSNDTLNKIHNKEFLYLRSIDVPNASDSSFCALTLHFTCPEVAATNQINFWTISNSFIAFKEFLPAYGVIGGFEICQKVKCSDSIFHCFLFKICLVDCI